MAFNSQVRCDIETLDVTINNYERMANAPEAWSRIKKLIEKKPTPPDTLKDAIALLKEMGGYGFVNVHQEEADVFLKGKLREAIAKLESIS